MIGNNYVVLLIDFRDRVVKMSMDFGHLVACTTTQIYIYNKKNWNTPTICDVKSGTVSLLLQADKVFCIADNVNGLQVFSYEGRLVSKPKFDGMHNEFLNKYTVSLCTDTVVMRDHR